MVKLLDYERQWENLEANTNPFAMIVRAHLKTKATTRNLEEREQWKWNLVSSLYEGGYNREEIVRLFQFIDRMMTLPFELQQSFEKRLSRYDRQDAYPTRRKERCLY